MDAVVERRERLNDAERAELLAEAQSWSARAEREALPEQARFGLLDGPPVCHLLGVVDGEVVYAQGRPVDGALEFVALADRLPEPLLDAVVSCCEERQSSVRIWTRHVAPESPGPSCHCTLNLDREILRLSGPVAGHAAGPLPRGLEVTTFRPGIDENDWLALNRRSFARHPEQGAVDRHGLDVRIAQAWFDPEGFVLLRQAGEMVAFCWTKVHDDPWGAVGEIYVIGVDPAFAGHGLGRIALLAGLAHLERRGLAEVMLYVEADNAPAIGLYRSLGLTESWRDRCWVGTP